MTPLSGSRRLNLSVNAGQWQWDRYNSNPIGKYKNSGAQTIANNTLTAVLWDTDTADRWDMHNTSTNTERILVTESGQFIVGVSIAWANDSTGSRIYAVQKNGATIFNERRVANTFTETTFVTPPQIMVTGDYFSIQAAQSSGGNLDLLAGSLIWVWKIS